MADNSRAVAAAVVGAVIGGMVGYLMFTERGRALRRQLEPVLDDVVRELSSFRTTVVKAASAASEGWRLLNDALGETGAPASRYPPGQHSPF